MKQFLIAHTCPNGQNTAQVVIPAKWDADARQVFRSTFPDRTISVVGVLGK